MYVETVSVVGNWEVHGSINILLTIVFPLADFLLSRVADQGMYAFVFLNGSYWPGKNAW